MDDHTAFVQFPHPGDEYTPPTDAMAWNLGDHRRKFLCCGGQLASAHDGPVARDLDL